MRDPIATGGAAPGSPLIVPAGEVKVSVSGIAASNVLSAMAPGMVGILQVNLQLPAVAAGDQALVVTVGGVASNVTYLPVATR